MDIGKTIKEYISDNFWSEQSGVKFSGIASVIGGAAIGFLSGNFLGGVLGAGAGLLLAPLLNALLNRGHTPLPAPNPLPGTKLIAKSPIVYKGKEVVKGKVDEKTPEAKTDTIEVAEILLKELNAPLKLIPELNGERIAIEKMVAASRTGNLSPSDKLAYGNRKKELEDGDMKVARFLINFQQYITETRSEKMFNTRKKLMAVLKGAGMSDDDIQKEIPAPPMVSITMEVPSLKEYDEKMYKKGLDLYAVSKKKSTDEVKAEWDGKGGFAQLNDMRNYTMKDAEDEWTGADKNKTEMYGLDDGKRQVANDVKNKSALQNGEFYSASFFGRIGKGLQGKAERWDDCEGQSICAHAADQLMSKNPYDAITIPKDTKGIMLPKLLHTKIVDKSKEYDIRSFDLSDLSKLKNYQYLSMVAVIGAIYAEGAGDTKGKEAYERVIRYCQACDRRLALDGVSENMNKYLEKLIDFRNKDIEEAQKKIKTFQDTGLGKLNSLVEARKKSGFAIVRKAVDENKAVIQVEDTQNNQKMTLFGTMKDGNFTATEAVLGHPNIDNLTPHNTDWGVVHMNTIAGRMALTGSTPVNLSFMEDISRVRTLIDSTATILKSRDSEIKKASEDAGITIVEQQKVDSGWNRTAVVVANKAGQRYKLILGEDRKVEEMHTQKSGAKTWEDRDVEKTFLMNNKPKIAEATDSANFTKDLNNAVTVSLEASGKWNPALTKAKLVIKKHLAGPSTDGGQIEVTDTATDKKYYITYGKGNTIEGISEQDNPAAPVAGGYTYSPEKETKVRLEKPEDFIEDITKLIKFHTDEMEKTKKAKTEKKMTITKNGATKVEYGKDTFDRQYVTIKNGARHDALMTLAFDSSGKVTHYKDGAVDETGHWSNNWVGMDYWKLNVNIGDGKDADKIRTAVIEIYKNRKDYNLDDIYVRSTKVGKDMVALIQPSPTNDNMENLGLMSSPLVGFKAKPLAQGQVA